MCSTARPGTCRAFALGRCAHTRGFRAAVAELGVVRRRSRIVNAALLIFCSVALASCSKQEQPQQPIVENPMNGTSEPTVANVPEIYRPFFDTFGRTEDDVAVARARLPFDSISLVRTPCYGLCPVYEVIFHRDGKAEFTAQENLPKLGKFVGQVRLGTYGRLCYLIENSHFADLKPSYRAAWTDDTTCILTVTRGKITKAVSDYGRVGPIELWAIQELIDAIRDKTEWTPVK